MVEWVRRHARNGLWAGMGIGKTSSVLVALDWMRLLGEIDVRNPTLVVGPMRVARDTWPEEVRKWDEFRDLTIVPLTGTPDERRLKLQTVADIYTISYELAPWLVERYLEKWPFRIVIADESDRLKGFREKSWTAKRQQSIGNDKKGRSGVRAYQLSRIAHNLVDRWINLTGTPATAGLQDLWGQTWFLDRGERLGSTFGAFQRRYFRRSWDADPTHGTMELMPGADQWIRDAVNDIHLTIDPKDYFNLQEPIYNRLEVNLPAGARKLYKQARKEMYIGLEELLGQPGGINIVNAGVLAQKCLQLANGAIYSDPKRTAWVKVHDEKLEALDSIIHEASGASVLVGINFRHDRERILRAFPQAVDIARPEGLAAFKAGKATVGVAHPKSMGHGIDGLQLVCHHLVYFGHDWKTGERLQFLERVGPMRQFQAGFERPLFVTDIVARDTEDENVMRVHHENRSVMDVLLESAKRFK
jgi:SNF2 family DNA or RNA helicase